MQIKQTLCFAIGCKWIHILIKRNTIYIPNIPGIIMVNVSPILDKLFVSETCPIANIIAPVIAIIEIQIFNGRECFSITFTVSPRLLSIYIIGAMQKII